MKMRFWHIRPRVPCVLDPLGLKKRKRKVKIGTCVSLSLQAQSEQTQSSSIHVNRNNAFRFGQNRNNYLNRLFRLNICLFRCGLNQATTN